MRRWIPGLLILFLVTDGAPPRPARITPENNPRAPLWYRDGGEKGHWTYGMPKDPAKRKALDRLEQRMRQLHGEQRWFLRPVVELGKDLLQAEIRHFLLDEDMALADRAVLSCRRDAAALPELEQAHRRWPGNSQIERVFAKTAADCWPDAKLRAYFWSLPAGTPRYGELYFALHRELARCGTLRDARRLEARLPAGADWRRDPVIVRIRLRHSEKPDELACEILKSLEDFRRSEDWSMYLLRCELLRYMTFGDSQRYRPYFEAYLDRMPFFRSDQETYPDGLKAMLMDWLKRHPL